MRNILMPIASAAIVVVVLACGGAAAPTLAPGATATPAGAPTQPPGGATQAPVVTTPPVSNTGICAGSPTYVPGSLATPAVLEDTTLDSRFPTTVDGQPVTDVHSNYWLSSSCFYGGNEADLARFMALFPAGVGQQISIGFGSVELDGNTVSIQAFRIPGVDPAPLFSHLPEFFAALGGDPANAATTVVTTGTVGGKNVYIVTDADGTVQSYDYVQGDTVWSISEDEATAGKVFAALP